MINWSKIDTVLLDMDGTLLDLRFDNYFWQTAVPEYFARKQGLSFEQAVEQLRPIFKAQEGLLSWYCLDYWSKELEIDIVKLKRGMCEQIKELPHTREFLQAVRLSGKRCVLVTNAHADSLLLKMQKTGLVGFFDAIVSSHDLGYPKEHQDFWRRLIKLEAFDKATTLLVDDSLSVLTAAAEFGIQHLIAVDQPDSTQPPRMIQNFAAVKDLRQIKPSS
ncbi:HAD family hydrolase [Cycloclasticus sp. 46_120_T64]|nr:HAD family hydrolase [Cycloclasticus sp. 46_120_T64]